jgi:ubiquinone/menaquinone biosynthesis C-methylase UbiE
MSQAPPIPDVDVDTLRCEIRNEYAEVADNPQKGFHFHTGRRLAKILFSLGAIQQGARVVDVGSGAGIDTLIAGHLTGPEGLVIGIDMTPEMLKKAAEAAEAAGMTHVEFRDGYAEALPVPDDWADVVISNGVVNLCPDKLTAFGEMYRVLKPGGRIQIGDILVQKEVPADAKRDIDLWKG